MSDYDFGVYILQQYAGVAKVSPQELVANFLKRYSKDDVRFLGSLAKPLSVSLVKEKFAEHVRQAPIPSLGFPSRSEISEILISAGAAQPSMLSVVGSGIASASSDIADFGIGGLKMLGIVGALALVAYILAQTGTLRGLFKKA